MSGPDRIDWRPAVPRHALRIAGSCAVLTGIAALGAWLLFGGEPETLDNGAPNRLASIPLWTTVFAVASTLLLLIPAVRRPAVSATHYALSVRPGCLRTLMLPWADIAEVTTLPVPTDPYLLIRLRRTGHSRNDRLTWWERAPLRSARRYGAEVAAYDLAVRLRDFAGPPDGKLATLAAYAPETVQISHRA